MLYKRNVMQYKSPAYVCKTIKHTVRTLTDFLGAHQKVEIKEEVATDPVDCERMQKWHTSKYGTLQPVEDFLATTNIPDWSYSAGGAYCCTQQEFFAFNVYLYKAFVYKRHGSPKMEGTPGNMQHCTYSKNNCQLRTGAFVGWTANSKELCEFVPWKEMSGRKWGTNWLSNSGELAVTTVSKRSVQDCTGSSKLLTMSDQGVAFDILTPRSKRSLGNKIPYKKEDSSNVGVVTTDDQAIHLQALEMRIQKNFEFNYMHQFYSTCRLMQELVSLVKTNILTNPTLAVRHLLRHPNLIAHSSGIALEIFPCQMFTSKQYKFLPMNNATCSSFIPIKFILLNTTHLGYLDPITNVIHQKMFPSDCSLVSTVLLQLGGETHLYNAKTGVVEKVNNLEPLPLVKWSASYPLSFNLTIHHSVVMYSWNDFVSHVSMNDIWDGMSKQQSILNHLGISNGNIDNPAQAAQDLSNTVMQRSLFGFLYGFGFSPYQVWLFFCCLYITIFAVFLHCCPALSHINIPKLWEKFYTSLRNWVGKRRANTPAVPPVQYIVHDRPPITINPSLLYPLDDTPPAPPNTPVLGASPTGWPPTYIALVSTSQPITRFIITIHVNEEPIQALIDTGSSITIISNVIAEKLGNISQENKLVAASVTGHKLNVMGTIEASISLNPHLKRLHRLQVVHNSPYQCVLGTDFLSLFESVTFDFAKNLLNIDNFDLKPNPNGPLHRAVGLIKEVHVPANTEVFINMKVPNFEINDQALLFEPDHAALSMRGLCSVATVLDPQNGRLPFRVFNPNINNITLKPGSHIGFIETNPIDFEPSWTVPEHLTGAIKVEPTEDRVKELFQQIHFDSSNLTTDQLQSLKNLIASNQHIFALKSSELGLCNWVQHTIDTGSNTPFKLPPFRVPLAKRPAIDNLINDMLRDGVIEHSDSPWSSPCFLVNKPDNTHRFVIDYRKLNNMTVKDTYPLPLIDTILDNLGGSQYYSTMDCQSGYWQVEMEEESKLKGAFCTHSGLYAPKKMSFGLCNAPATWMRLMQTVLRPVHKHTYCYLDDIIVTGKTFQEHLNNLQETFNCLDNANIKLKGKKCNFCCKTLRFLGFLISSKGIKPNEDKVTAVKNFPTPTCVRDVQVFLGMAGFYRKSILGFAQIAKPLFQLLQNENNFSWTDPCQQSLDKLKQLLCTAPVLAYPNLDKEFIIQTDASGYAIGAIISQKDDDDREHPIAYASRSLRKAELNYSTVEKETLAIVWALRHFRHYIVSAPKGCLVETDHSSVRQILEYKNPSNSRLVRWQATLLGDDVKIRYKMGRLNKNADALSRFPTDIVNGEPPVSFQSGDDPLEALDGLFAIHETDTLVYDTEPNKEFGRKEQLQDQLLADLIHYIEHRTLPSDTNRAKFITNNRPHFALIQGNLFRFSNKQHSQLRWVVPSQLKQSVMHAMHDHKLAGHVGYKNTYDCLRLRFYWDNMYEDTVKYVSACTICNSQRPYKSLKLAPLTPLPPVVLPFERVGLDLSGPYKQTARGNRYIVAFQCYATKWPEAFPIPDQRAVTIATILVTEIVCRYGAPKCIHTDKGANLLSEVVAETCKLLKIDRINTSAYHPQSNGLIERFNRSLGRMLSAFTDNDQTDWDLLIPFCLFSYRSCIQDSTKESPYYLVFGRQPNFPIEVALLPPNPCQYLLEPHFVENLITKLQASWHLACTLNIDAQQKQKHYHDKRSKLYVYKIGDLVWVLNEAVPIGLSKKLTRPFRGPYIVEDINDKDNVLKLVPHKRPDLRPYVVHINRVKPFQTPVTLE